MNPRPESRKYSFLVVVLLCASMSGLYVGLKVVPLTSSDMRAFALEQKAVAHPVDIQMPVPKEETRKPVIGYFTAGGMPTTPPSRPYLQVLVAIWNDGKILWSSNLIEGGTPYYAGSIDPATVESLLRNFAREGYLKDPSLRRFHFGPDARTTTITVASGTEVLTMVSWHELAERNPKVLGTSIGLVSSEGKTWEEIADKEPEEYVNFRRVWKEIRTDLLGLIPKEGAKEIGEMEFELK